MATQNLDAADLAAINSGGLINEDVMQQIWDISRIPLPVLDMVGSDTAGNAYKEWTTDELADPRQPAAANFRVDGADTDKNETANGERLGNQHGIMDREVRVSGRAEASDTIGNAGSLSYQVMMRQRELRRDVEAAFLSILGSQADNGDATPGIPAGLATMATVFDNGSGHTAGSFSSGVWTGFAPGTAQALTYADVQDALQAAYVDNADPTYLMSVPGVIRELSQFMFTSNAPIATLQRDTNNVGSGGAATAVGSVNVLISDFGQTVTMQANRLQRTYDDDQGTPVQAASVFLLDPAYLRLCTMEGRGFRVNPLAKTGDSEKRQMLVDFSVILTNLKSNRVIPDINPTVAVTAT